MPSSVAGSDSGNAGSGKTSSLPKVPSPGVPPTGGMWQEGACGCSGDDERCDCNTDDVLLGWKGDWPINAMSNGEEQRSLSDADIGISQGNFLGANSRISDIDSATPGVAAEVIDRVAIGLPIVDEPIMCRGGACASFGVGAYGQLAPLAGTDGAACGDGVNPSDFDCTSPGLGGLPAKPPGRELGGRRPDPPPSLGAGDLRQQYSDSTSGGSESCSVDDFPWPSCVIELWCAPLQYLGPLGIVHCWVEVKHCDGSRERYDKWADEYTARKIEEINKNRKSGAKMRALTQPGGDPESSNVFVNLYPPGHGILGVGGGKGYMVYKEEHSCGAFMCLLGYEEAPECKRLTPENVARIRYGDIYTYLWPNSNTFAQSVLSLAGIPYDIPVGAVGAGDVGTIGDDYPRDSSDDNADED